MEGRLTHMHTHLKLRRTTVRRGGVLITTLIISTIVASMLAGMGTLLTSYYSRAVDETNYANAINIADAGINYEIRRITANVSNADMPGTTAPYGSLVSFGNGSFRVYCTMSDGTTAWDKTTTPFYVFSTGISGATSRSVRVSCSGYDTGTMPQLSVFGTNSFNFHAPGITVTSGDIGTNGSMSLHGHVPNGNCYICGSGASGSGAGAGCPTINLANALNFPTVSAVALSMFPNSGATAPGGLSYLALHNDNSKVGLPLLLPGILGSITLTGPGNYYLTSLNLVGTSVLTCNNTNGPINIWVGPQGGLGTVNFDGTASITTTSNAPRQTP